MPIPIKYTTTNVSSSVRLGNIALGVNAVDYGPSSTSNWTNGVGATYDGYAGGYVIYYLSGTNIRIRTADTFTLTTVAGQIMNATYANNSAALSALAGAGYTVINTSAPSNCVTNGLVINFDASLIMSYPQINTTWYDISGNANNGTLLNGPTFNSTANAISFDGVDDYAVSSNVLSLSNFTAEAWFYPTSNPGNYASVISTEYPGTNSTVNYTLSWNGGTFQGGFYNASSGGWHQVVVTNPTLNKWNHYVVTYNGSSLIVYINGVYNNSMNTTDTAAGGGVTRIARRWDLPDYFPGSIATARVYNRALSASEVLQNYYKGNIVTSGLVMALDAGNLISYPATGTTWTDLTGSVSGTLTNGPTFNSGNGGSIVFDGVDDYVKIPNREDLDFPNANFTAACWFKSTQSKAYVGLTGKIQFGTGTQGWALQFSDAKVTSWINNTLLQSPLTYNDGKWHYAVMTCGTPSTGTRIIYVDGVQVASDTMPSHSFDPVNLDLWVGGWTDGTSYLFNGNIAITQIYNRTLTSTEVAQNFNAYRNRFNV